jgi:tripeptide aminopeptidase
MINKERLVNNFLRLAAVNSYTRHEAKVADMLEPDLQSLGFETCRDDAGEKIGGDTGNIIARKKGNVPGATPIMFSAHMDTVEPTEGWGYKIEDGIIRSTGKTILGADDKAGIAAIIEAITVMGEEGIPHGDIEIVFSIAEEIGLYGAINLDLGKLESKCAFVYDAGCPLGGITISAPYHDDIIARIYGRNAHAGMNPEGGINAIVAAGKAVSRMKLGRIDEETTANIGKIQGGTARNIVAAYCEVVGEARSRTESKVNAQAEHMVEEFERAAEEMGARAEVEVIRSYDGFKIPVDSQVVQIAAEAARRVGIEPQMHGGGGGSDANVMNSHEFPAAVIGVGYVNPHSVDEYVAVDDMVKSAAMALEIIKVAAGK